MKTVSGGVPAMSLQAELVFGWQDAAQLKRLFLVSALVSRDICQLIPNSVVPGIEGEELTIWDSKESEFASGLEYQVILRCANYYTQKCFDSNMVPQLG
jgi:hypothetical protein